MLLNHFLRAIILPAATRRVQKPHPNCFTLENPQLPPYLSMLLKPILDRLKGWFALIYFHVLYPFGVFTVYALFQNNMSAHIRVSPDYYHQQNLFNNRWMIMDMHLSD